MPLDVIARALKALFDGERAARQAQDELLEADPQRVLPVLEKSTQEALALDATDEDESSMRLVRIAGVLGEMQGGRVVDLLIEILGSDEPEARHAAGEALSGLAFERFKEVALGIERALERLPTGSPAICELPYLLAQIPEPGVVALLGRFLALADADAVASAIEAMVEMGDPAALPLLQRLSADPRRVQLEDAGGTEAEASIGELVSEARTLLAKQGAA